MEGGRDAAGLWCADNASICSSLWWCGPRGYVLSTAAGVVLWGALFLGISGLLYPLVRPWLERYPSKIPEETGASWFTWHIQSTIHACIVSYMAAASTHSLWTSQSAIAQFDAPSRQYSAYMSDIASIALGSHVFFCYMLVDTVVAVYRRAGVDYFVHHAIFCFFCLLIQYHCFAPYLAGWLLIMEISTVFLNGFSFFRNRLGYGHWFVKLSFFLFGNSFFAVRLCGTTFIALAFGREVLLGEVLFEGIPRIHLHLLGVALVGAVGIQVYWGVAIGRKLIRVMSTSSASASSDGGRNTEGKEKSG